MFRGAVFAMTLRESSVMHPLLDETIAALASAAGPGGRGIIRVSGTDCRRLLEQIVEWDDAAEVDRAKSARVHHATIRFGSHAAYKTLVYLWPGRRSYTGQPLAELHMLSSPPLLDAVLARIFEAGARPARPGEFTLRAFLSGRLDLIQAEAVLGVIDADDQKQLELALRQLGGGISTPLAAVRNDLLNLLADLEAGLDFVDEDISFVGHGDLLARLAAARLVSAGLLIKASGRMQSTGRRRVLLAGLPNAGKSTLFNALLSRDAALVSDVSGTTRDTLHATVEWLGVPLELIDTPGRDGAVSEIEGEAQRLANEQTEVSHIIVWCTASALSPDELEHDADVRNQISKTHSTLLPVITKCDLSGSRIEAYEIAISARTGEGLDEFKQQVIDRLNGSAGGRSELVGATAARCHESLSKTIVTLDAALESARNSAGDEIIAMELREALDHIGRILGAVYTDDILDRIFSRFCIGK